jgi:hypothetical protein
MVTASSQVSDALRSAALGMRAPRDHLERIAGAISASLAVAHDRHFAFENEQARIEFLRVLGIDRACVHPAIDDLPIALRFQFVLEIRPVHGFLLGQFVYDVAIVACVGVGRAINSA